MDTEQSIYIYCILDHLRYTAEGWNQIPAWFLRLFAPIYAYLSLVLIINNSIASSHVPEQWKIAVITFVPKIDNSTSPADRPISSLSILSRIVERIVVRTYLRLSLS